MAVNANTPNDAINLSQQLLYRVKTSRATKDLLDQLSNFTRNELAKRLRHDEEKKAFWINLYNACTILLLKDNPDKLSSAIEKLTHFTSKQIHVADKWLSLNDIEHGMLRHSKIWWGKGYLHKPFVSHYEKMLRVEEVDPRIHFALNCGAASCPPIRFYEVDQLEDQLDLATEVFLESTVSFNNEANTVTITPLFDWYKTDFGGKKGTIAFLKQYKFIPHNSYPIIQYERYNWEAELDAFADE